MIRCLSIIHKIKGRGKFDRFQELEIIYKKKELIKCEKSLLLLTAKYSIVLFVAIKNGNIFLCRQKLKYIHLKKLLQLKVQ